jgi:hypothetical protein
MPALRRLANVACPAAIAAVILAVSPIVAHGGLTAMYRSSNAVTAWAWARIGPRPDTPDRYGMLPLVVAARRGRTGAVRALLAAGADPNLRDHHGRSALVAAAARGHAAAVRELIAGGADPARPDARGMTPLAAATLGAWAGTAQAVRDALEQTR